MSMTRSGTARARESGPTMLSRLGIVVDEGENEEGAAGDA
jgi:hypothetical protein